MGAGKSLNFKPAVLDKYATPAYYLSKGASGIVYGPIPWQGSQLAIKQAFFTDGKVTEEFNKRLEEKKVVWTSLEHKNLMRIHWVDLTRLPKVMFLVMEFANGGSLFKTLRSLEPRRKLPINVVTEWSTQIAEGMMYLHEKDIVHRDLKSSNILLMETFDAGSPERVLTLKISDFDEIQEHDHTITMSFVGTWAYMAPEVLKDQLFSKASDVWSYGVVIWEMLSGDIPHKGLEQSTIISKSINGELDNLPLELSFPEDFKLLLKRCWKSTHTERIPFHGIISSILQRIVVDEPELTRTLTPKAAYGGQKAVLGLTILGEELFVLSHDWPKIEVFGDLQKLESRREFLLTGHQLEIPWDMQSSFKYNCLYIVDKKRNEKQHTDIVRIDAEGYVQKIWKTDCMAGHLSVTSESNVIVTSHYDLRIREYSYDGELIREIELPIDIVVNPWVTLKRGKDEYITSYGNWGDSRQGVCVIDKNGNIQDHFGGKIKQSNDPLHAPAHMTAFSEGHILVADKYNSRVVLLTPDLKFLRAIFTPPLERYPNRLCLDERNKQLFVSDYHWISDAKPWNDGRVLVFDMSSVQTTFNIFSYAI